MHIKLSFDYNGNPTRNTKWIADVKNGEGNASIKILPRKESVLTEWSDWSSCTKTCMNPTILDLPGKKFRQRTCIPGINGKQTCAQLNSTKLFGESQFCFLDLCPVDFKLTEWDDWSECLPPCGESRERTRRRACIPPSVGGTPCPTNNTMTFETKACPAKNYCNDDCQLNPWTAWTPCSATCYTSSNFPTQQRSRAIVKQAGKRGVPCKDFNLAEVRRCIMSVTTQCPVWGDWSDWGPCNTQCNGGIKERISVCSVPNMCQAGNDGNRSLKTEDEPCNIQPCECQWQEWLPWSDCTRKCGVGFRERRREGYDYGILREQDETEYCWEGKCPESAKFSLISLTVTLSGDVSLRCFKR